MSSEGADPVANDEYHQRDDSVVMQRSGNKVIPDFEFSSSPTPPRTLEDPEYDLYQLDVGGRSKTVPEMDFRQLSDITNTQYLTHAIHKHPAVFIPQIPDYIIDRFTSETNCDGNRPLVLDPFSGSGTSGIEARVAGRDYLGIEINPLSKLVSEVATSPIPPSLLRVVEEEVVELLAQTDEKLYEEYDIEIPGRTSKEHWFEQRAIRDLTRIRKVVTEYTEDPIEIPAHLSRRERQIVSDLGLSEDDLNSRIERWLVLMVANTVFDVSNADPKVSKAHKSETMRNKIEAGEHPPANICYLYGTHLHTSREKLLDLWETIYGTRDYTQTEDTTFDEALLAENQKHNSEVDIRLGDARTFDLRDEKRQADIALTSPPYINAINYYRGTKLRLFWIQDLLEDRFEPMELRRSIAGTNSAGVNKFDGELPAKMEDIWRCSPAEFEDTKLPKLDEDIDEIHNGSLVEARRRALTTWRFFAEDMLQSIARTYEHLRPGAYFFLFIGENKIGGRHIQSHEYVADIAENLGKFDPEVSGGAFDESDGFRVVGIAIDEITNRDLFEERNHRSGIIDHEWVVMLQKPPEEE